MLISLVTLSLSAFLSACGGCGPDPEPTEDKCEGVTCERGMCSSDTGECANADACDGDDTRCLDGYSCDDADNSCKADFPCEDDGTCDRGECQAGACVDKESCEADSDCLEGNFCGDDGVCAEDPCATTTCDRGVCEKGTGECVNKEICAADQEAVDCIDGFKCYGQACVDEEGFCAALACESGVCSFDDKECVNADDCAGDDGQCLDGYFCNESNECQENACDQNMVMCDRGVCERVSGDCVNPDSCDAASECLPGHLCVANECVIEDVACGEEGCPGNQTCFYDEPQLLAVCQENLDDGCTTAVDCVDDRVCVDNSCSAPAACEPDAFEPNNDNDGATNFFDATLTGALRATLCGGDVDVFSYDTNADDDLTGTLLVELAYDAPDIGLGTLKIELVNEGGMAVGEAVAQDGVATLQTDITLINRGVYSLRVSDEGDVSTAGIRYRLSMDVVDNTVIQACETAPVLAADTPQEGNTISGNSSALRASCADPTGVNAEDIWAIELTEKALVEVTATPTMGMNSDVSVSLRSDCLNNTTEILGACAETAGVDGAETVSALLEPGTYYAVVQGAGEMTGGSYSVSYTATTVVCTSADDSCSDADTASICRPDGSGFDTEACDSGCNSTLGECNRRQGDLCSSAPVVDVAAGYSGSIEWGKYKPDYDPGAAGCVPTADGEATSGPDVTYSVEVPPSYSLTVDLESQGADNVSLYIVEDCRDLGTTCLSGQNVDGAERLFWINETMAPKTVYVVADVAAGATYDNALITIATAEVICTPGQSYCTIDGGGQPASHVCDQFGTGYENLEACPYGCDPMAGVCQNPMNDTCTGAAEIISGMPLTGVVLGDFTNTDALSGSDCTGFGTPGPDAIYKIAANEGDIIEATLASTFDGSLWASASCDAMNDTVGACIVGADEGGSTTDETILFRADTAGDYFIVVSSFSSSAAGSFDLTVTATAAQCTPGQAYTCEVGSTDTIEYCDDLGRLQTYKCSTTCTAGACDDPAGDVCVDPIALSPAGGTLASSFGGTNSIEFPSGVSGTCVASSASDGRENVYAIDLAQGDLLRATLNSVSSTGQIFIMSDCNDLNSCKKSFSGASSGTVQYFAEAPGTYFVVVDNTNATTSDTFDLSWEIISGLACAPGESSCQDASTVAVCNADGTAVGFTSTCAGGCTGGFCIGDVATSDTCAAANTAADIGAGINAFFNYDDLTNDIDMPSSACVGQQTDGNDAFYKVTVQNGEILYARVRALSQFEDPQVYIIEDCADAEGTCLSGAPENADAFTAETYYANNSGAAKTVIVVADNESSFADEPFSFFIEKRSPECTPGINTCEPSTSGGNDTLKLCNEYGLYDLYTCDGTCGVTNPNACDNPTGNICIDSIPLTGPSGELVDVDFSNSNDIELGVGRTGGCFIDDFDENDGYDTFYRIDLNAGELLDVQLDTTETAAMLLLFEGCDQNACLTNNPVTGSTRLTHYADTPKTVTIVVDTDSTFGIDDPYTLRWNVRTGLACDPGQYRCIPNTNDLGLCAADGLTETPIPCNGTCSDGFCEFDAGADLCANASAAMTDIGAGISVAASYDDLTNDIDMPDTNCTGAQTDGPDAFYKVTVQPGEILHAWVEAFDEFESPLVYAIEDCADAENTCVAGVQETGTSGRADLYWSNTDMVAKTLIVGADNESSFADGHFALRIEKRAPECVPGSIQCAADQATLQLCNSVGLYDNFACNGTCGLVNTNACDNPTGGVCYDAIPLAYPMGELVDEDFSSTNNIELPEGRTGGCFYDSFDENDGYDTFYRIDLNAGDVLEVELDTVETAALLLLFEGCDQNSCVANNPISGPTTLTYYADTAKSITVVVDADTTFGLDDPYTLRWNVRTGLACAPDAFRCVDGTTLGICSADGTSETQVTCATSCSDGYCEFDTTADVCADVSTAMVDIGAGISIAGDYDQLTDDIDMPSSACAGVQTDGPDAFYQVTVQPGEILHAWVDAFDDFEAPIVYAIEDCADAENTCVAGAEEQGSSGRAELYYVNSDPAAKTLIVAADNESSSADGLFGLYIEKLVPQCVAGDMNCAADGQTLRLCNSFGLYDLYTCNGTCGQVNPGACDMPSGDVCFDAVPLVGTTGSLVDQAFDGENNYELNSGRSGGCFVDDFDENDGADAFYRVELNAGEVLTVDLTTVHDEAYLFLLEGCASADQCVKNNFSQGSTSLNYYADTAKTVTVVVDTDIASTDETYTLSWSIATGLSCAPNSYRCVDNTTLSKCSSDGATEAQIVCAAGCSDGACVEDQVANDLCVDVETAAGNEIGDGIAVYGTFDGHTDSVDMPDTSCVGEQTDGNDAFYKVIVQPGNILHAWADSYGDESPLIYAIESCGDAEGTCLAGAAEFASSNRAEIYWVNSTGAAKTVIVGVDSEFSTNDEPFGLFIEQVPPSCTAGMVTCSAGQLQVCNQFGLYDYFACDMAGCNVAGDACANPQGEVCADAIVLTGNGTVSSDFTGSNQVILDGGRTNGCFVDDFDQSDGNDRFFRVDLNAGEVFRASLATAHSTAHMFLTQNCGDANSCVLNDPSLGSGTIEYYAPTAETLFLTIDSTTDNAETFDLTYEIVSGLVCAPGEFRCVDAMTLGHCSADGLTEITTACACADNACVEDIMTNDTCVAGAGQPLITGSIAIYSNYDLHTNDVEIPSSGCVGETTDGNDMFYPVEVQPGEILHAWVDSYGDEAPLVYAFTDCMDPEGTCLAGADETGSTNRAEIFYNNASGVAQTVIVAADGEWDFADEPFGLFIEKRTPECMGGTVQCSADGTTLQICNDANLFDNYACNGGCDSMTNSCVNPTGDICLDTIKVNPGGSPIPPMQTEVVFSYTGISFGNLSNSQTLDAATGCTAYDDANGTDQIYEVTLLPGQVMDVDETTAADAVLYVLSTCGDGGASCVAGADDTFSGDTESVSYTNSTMQPLTLFVVADSYSASTSTFDLTITIR